ncbi:MAG: transglutaminase-like cysteine peptidase [Gammaproteobacteria bacterium]|nr:transglutaminase-like cysteine peptidase [Gammaproteobacteria bacterium]
MLSPGAWLLLLVTVTASANYNFDAPDDFLASADVWPAWAQNLQRHTTEREAIKRCLDQESACSGKLKSLRYVLVKGAALDRDRQLRLVNRYINKRRYKRDRRQTSLSVAPGGEAKLKNHWSTLLEFLQRGGDCEDFAVAKYFLLRELGFPAEDMRVLVTWEKSARDYHAVLAVRRDDGSSWLLESDNTIVKGNHRRYRFIYALNEEGIWDHAE